MASNLVFTIWAVFGGFILHFLLSNYLTVLLRPSYEPAVDTAADIIENDITPFIWPGAEIYTDLFANSPDPNYQEISRRLVVAKDFDVYEDMVRKCLSTGLYTSLRKVPWCFNDLLQLQCAKEFKDWWYRSSNPISGAYPYQIHLSNKKWPLKKVF